MGLASHGLCGGQEMALPSPVVPAGDGARPWSAHAADTPAPPRDKAPVQGESGLCQEPHALRSLLRILL